MTIMQMTLEYFYEENLLGNNTWSASNQFYDLAKYRGTRLIFHRDLDVSYIVIVTRGGKNHFNRFELFQNTHPWRMLGSRKRIIVWSKKERPNRKNYVTLWVPPPQLMTTRWFFQQDICNTPLLVIQACAFSPDTPIFGRWDLRNSCLTIWGFHYHSVPQTGDSYASWFCRTALAHSTYNDLQTQCQKLFDSEYWDAAAKNSWTVNGNGSAKQSGDRKNAISINWWHSSWPPNWKGENWKDQTPYPYRYCWHRDNGIGNKVRILNKRLDPAGPYRDIEFSDKPLPVLLNGYYDWIKDHTRYDPKNWVMAIDCPYTRPIMHQVILMDQTVFQTFLKKGAATDVTNKKGDKPIVGTTTEIKEKIGDMGFAGTLSLIHQTEQLRLIYIGSPWTIKNNRTVGQIYFSYQSYWQWGGDFIEQKPIDDPCKKPIWDGHPHPGYDYKSIQITDPKEGTDEALLRSFDLRRGDITKRALKRIIDSAPTGPEEDPEETRRYREKLPSGEKQGPPVAKRLKVLHTREENEAQEDASLGETETSSASSETEETWNTQETQALHKRIQREHRHRRDRERTIRRVLRALRKHQRCNTLTLGGTLP